LNKLLKLNFLIPLFLFCIHIHVQAQDELVSGPVYPVQAGDTLWGISRTFNVSIDDLVDLNSISDPSRLTIGTSLIIPGLEGLEGTLAIKSVPFGESFKSLSRRYQMPFIDLARLNRYTTPDNAAAGSSLIALDLENEGDPLIGGRTAIQSGVSLFETAIVLDSSHWVVAAENGILGVRDTIPGDILYYSGSNDGGPGALPEMVSGVQLDQAPLVQGKTAVYYVTSNENISIKGNLIDYELHFSPYENGYVALQGVHATVDPGYYPSTISIILDDGSEFEFSQKVYVESGNYEFDPPLVVNSETIDIENTQPEDLEWFSIVEPFTEVRMWEGKFSPPVPEYLAACYPSTFGKRRSYNGSAYNFFHTGLDFCGTRGVEIYAPAPGRVIYTDELVVRGFATVIDHGWGVYTAYAHQSEILVNVGELVDKGQLIGLIGDTGRVTGPHLHWEVIVGGVQIDPLDWLSGEYP